MDHLESWSISGSKEKISNLLSMWEYILFYFFTAPRLVCNDKLFSISCRATELKHDVPEVKIHL